ncbi:MAG: BlaI/MecI/CopY family transcriptional regulator [Verrucomicrobiales bacterium]|nr:BlaI/MecI/CopY family transcriptional regulator [Verrucomicrobiales bacterium]
MKKVPRISETEWQIMKIVWSKGQCTANEILDALNSREPWHPKTARTLIGRLVKKRALTYKEDGRAYIYRPGISESEAIAHYSESFLDRVFDGALAPMLAHFVQSNRLSASDLKHLREVIDDRE